jgi:hypothetical protein
MTRQNYSGEAKFEGYDVFSAAGPSQSAKQSRLIKVARRLPSLRAAYPSEIDGVMG